MKKQEYLSKVSDIFETLSQSIEDFKSGKISDKEMQDILRKANEDKPKGWMLVNAELAETLELDEDQIDEVVEDPYYEQNKQFIEEMIDELIADVPNWKENDHGRLSVMGSGSLIPAIIGEAEWEYCRF